jgi:hypothetical protein
MIPPDELTPETPHHHKWWMSEIPSVLALVFRCNCGATLTSEQTILEALNLKEARIEALEEENRALRAKISTSVLGSLGGKDALRGGEETHG